MVEQLAIRGWRNAHSPSKLGWPSRMAKWEFVILSPSKCLTFLHRAIQVFDVSFRHPSECLTFRFVIGWRVKCSHLACEISLTIRMVIHSPSLGVTSHCRTRGHPFAILGCDLYIYKWLSSQTWTWKLQVLRRRIPVSQCQSDLKISWACFVAGVVTLNTLFGAISDNRRLGSYLKPNDRHHIKGGMRLLWVLFIGLCRSQGIPFPFCWHHCGIDCRLGLIAGCSFDTYVYM